MAEKKDNQQNPEVAVTLAILTSSLLTSIRSCQDRPPQTQTYEAPSYRPSPADNYPSFTPSQIVTIQVGVGMVVVVFVAALLIAMEAKKQKRTTPKATQPTGAKPYAKGRRDNPHKRKYYPVNGDNQVKPSACSSPEGGNEPQTPPKGGETYKRKPRPVNGDNRVTPSPQPQGHPEIPERIIEGVMRMNLDRATAIRLLEWTASRHPKEGWGWVAEKVIFDLERDRSRA